MSFMLRICSLLLLVVFISACSSDDVNEPVELKDFEPSLVIDEVWSTSVGDGSGEQYLNFVPAIKGDFIYTVDLDGELTALNRFDGEEVWSRSLDLSVSGGIGVDDKHLYLATMHGELLALDRNDGHEVWRKTVTSEILSAPRSNGQLVVAQSIDGKLLAADADSGEIRWRYDSTVPVLSLRGTASPLVDDSFSIAGFANGDLTAVDNSNGRAYWTIPVGVPKGRTELERLVDVDGDAVISEGRLYIVSYQGKLMVVDLSAAHEVWSTAQSSYNGLALGYTHIYLTNEDGQVVAYKQKSPDILWKSEELKYRRLLTPVVFGDSVVVSDFEGYIHFLSQVDGHLQAREHVDSDGVMNYMKSVGDLLYVYGRSGRLYAYRVEDKS